MAHPALISTNGYHHLLLGQVEVIQTFGALALPEVLGMCLWRSNDNGAMHSFDINSNNRNDQVSDNATDQNTLNNE